MHLSPCWTFCITAVESIKLFVLGRWLSNALMNCSCVCSDHCGADGAASQVKKCGYVCRQCRLHTCPLFFSFNQWMCWWSLTTCVSFSNKIGFLNCQKVSCWFFFFFNSNVKSSGLCTHNLKGHKHKLNAAFNTSVMISIKMLIVIMAEMGHFTSWGRFCFHEHDFKIGEKVI